jgi:hypothetical protein
MLDVPLPVMYPLALIVDLYLTQASKWEYTGVIGQKARIAGE